MKLHAVKGAAFGLTSGIITTLGMMTGLFSFTGSRLVVLGGIISIALADSFSDALGIHLSEEADKKNTHRQVWITTITTFLTKIFFSSTFIIPILLFDLQFAIIISMAWGFISLTALNAFIARMQKKNALHMISEHLLIAVIVVVATFLIGRLVSQNF